MIIAIIFLSLALAFLLSGLFCNKNLKTNFIKVQFDALPKNFNGFRIAQISDLHNCEHGKDNAKTLKLLKKSHPDMIVITGDMIDSRHTRIDVAVEFAKKAVKIAPCYYVCGNHEARMPKEYDTLLRRLKNAGVKPLQNEKVTIEKNNQKISLIGVEDPYVIRKSCDTPNQEIMDNILKKFDAKALGFSILLSHRPELLPVYAKHGINLALTGHAHGGQIRLPFIGGLFAPNQGFLPKYCNLFYKEQNTVMIISNGVGNSQFPVRFFNPPQIPVIELHKA